MEPYPTCTVPFPIPPEPAGCNDPAQPPEVGGHYCPRAFALVTTTSEWFDKLPPDLQVLGWDWSAGHADSWVREAGASCYESDAAGSCWPAWSSDASGDRCLSSAASVSADDDDVPAELPMTEEVSQDLATIAEKNVRVRFCALWCAKYASDNGYTGNACCAVKCAPRVPAQPAAPRARPRMNPQRDRTAAFGRTTPAPRRCARSPTTATHEGSEDTRRSLLR